MTEASRAVEAVSYVFLILTWLAVLLRCYVRIKLVNKFGIDDFLMVTALPVYTLFCSFAIASTYYGTGRHQNTLTPEQIRYGLMMWKGGELSYVISSAVAKLSVGFFLLRVAVQEIHRRVLHIAMVITAFCGVVFFFILMLQCIPVSYFWEQITHSEKGRCLPNLLVMGGSFAYMTVGGLCDFVFGLLPICIVWPLNIGRWTKVALILILGLGALAGAATVIRMPYIREFAFSNDFLWITRYIVLWSLIEVGLGMTAGSLATTRPLYRKLFKNSHEGDMEFVPAPAPGNNGNKNGKRRGWTTWQMQVTTRARPSSLDVELFNSDSEHSRVNPRKGKLGKVQVVPCSKESSTLDSMDGGPEQPERAYARKY